VHRNNLSFSTDCIQYVTSTCKGTDHQQVRSDPRSARKVFGELPVSFHPGTEVAQAWSPTLWRNEPTSLAFEWRWARRRRMCYRVLASAAMSVGTGCVWVRVVCGISAEFLGNARSW